MGAVQTLVEALLLQVVNESDRGENVRKEQIPQAVVDRELVLLTKHPNVIQDLRQRQLAGRGSGCAHVGLRARCEPGILH